MWNKDFGQIDTSDSIEERIHNLFSNAKKLKTPEREAEYENIRKDYFKVLDDAGTILYLKEWKCIYLFIIFIINFSSISWLLYRWKSSTSKSNVWLGGSLFETLGSRITQVQNGAGSW